MYKAFISYSHSADGKLALVLQKALEGFAKPWYKLRNFNVFRDEDTMSSTHDLEGNINFALKEAEFSIFLASPASANSKWVQKEIKYWVENKPIDNLIIVLTDGEINWVDESRTFSDSTLNALPGILQRMFLREPFYVDLRQIKTTKDISLHNPIFKKEVLKLAAPLHNKQPKDLAGDEVIAHRKMMRVRNGAIGALALLLFAALIAGFIANENRKQAIESRNQAIENKNQAVQNANEAKRQEKIAIIQKDSANQARIYALKQENIAQLAKDTAIMERDNAIHQREIAIEQKKQALANFLVSEARNVVNTNPTLALRLLEQAMRYHNNSSIKQAALNIYLNNNFYKSANDAEISQLRSKQSIRNTRFYLHSSNPVSPGKELPYLSDSAKQKKVEIKLHFRSDYKLNISPDNYYLTAFSKDGEIKIRRIKGKKIDELKIDSITDFTIKTSNIITNVQILMDKKIILVTEDYSTVVKIFNFEGKHIQDLIGHDYPIQSVFALDENTIYTSSIGYYRTEYYPTRKWSISNTVINDFEGARPKVNSDFAGLSHDMRTDGKTFSPDRRTYLKNNWNDLDYAMNVSLRNLQGQVIKHFFVATELITAASFSPEGSYIFIGLNNGTVKMHDYKGLLLRTFDFSDQKKIIAFAFTPDKKKVLIYTEDHKCKFWEIPLPLEAFLKSDKIEPLSAEQKKIYSIE